MVSGWLPHGWLLSMVAFVKYLLAARHHVDELYDPTVRVHVNKLSHCIVVYTSICQISFRCAMFSFYSSWSCTQEDEGNTDFRQLFPYRYFRMAWYAYLKLLDINMDDGFMCKDCGPNPDMILCDATSIGHRKIYQNWLEKKHFTGKRSGR